MSRKYFLFYLLIITWGIIYAQDRNNNIVDISLSSIPDTSLKNYYTIFINIHIKDGWHLNSNKPLDEYLTPTSVKLVDTSEMKIVSSDYPPDMITKLQFSDSELSLYEGMIMIKVNLKVDDAFVKNKKMVEFELQYQSCNNQTCLFPVQKIISVNL